MTGALLRSGRISSFKALGKTGQPVHRAALQLRNAIKRKDKRYALCLAIPQTDQQGDNIDWYSPVAGDVISWGAATETERAVARSRLEAVKAYLTTMREELLASEAKKTEDKSKDKQVFAELLEYVIHFPGEDFVYLVRSEEGDEQFEHNGRLDTSSNVIPVLTFWGFLHSDDMLSSDPLYCLYPPKPIEPPVAAPVVTPAVAPVVTPKVTPAAPSSTPAPEIITPTRMPWWKNWRRWLRWLLLLLLLLLLLFFLRACIPGAASVVPSLNLPGSKPTMPKVSRAKDSLSSGEMSGMNMPDMNMPSVNMPDMNMPSVNMPDMDMPSMDMPGMDMPSMNMPDMDMPSMDMPNEKGSTGEEPASAVDSDNSNGRAEPESEPATTASSLSDESTAPELEPAVEPAALPAEQPGEPELPATDTPEPESLRIPPQADTNSSVDFLNGHWKAKGGIQDQRTGKPLRLEYQFNDGKGDVTVRRSDGVSCTGPVSAGIDNGNLAINSQGQAKCSDGGVYDMPAVNCKPDALSMADCTGRYGNETFPMTMRNADEQGGA